MEEAKESRREQGEEGKEFIQQRKEEEKEKEKDKKKAEKGEEKAEETPASSSRLGGRTVAKKPLSTLFSGTGMDPDPSRRKRLARRVKKNLKRGKSSSGTSSSSSDSSASSEDNTASLLTDRNKVLRIAQMAPGLLSSLTIQQSKPHVASLTTSGWETDEKCVPPLMGVYNRAFLAPRLSGGISREATTLCYAADLLIQGRPSEALDCLIQRVKSIEASAQGTPWQTAQRMEVVPTPEPQLGTRGEYQSARRESKLDSEAMGRSSQPDKGSGKGKSKGKEKSQGKGKAKAKEGDNKK